MKTLSKQSGVSLIEVLVVLVILLIGIFSVIRLFPPGFLINRQTESATLAARLAKQEVDRFTQISASLPDAIVPVVPVAISSPPGYAWTLDQDATPDDNSEAGASIPGVDPFYFSNVNKQRRIVGENTRIPIPSPTVAGRGSVYVLSSGPIYNTPWFGKADSVFVSGASLFALQLDSSAYPDPGVWLRGPAQYAIDYDDKKIGFFPTSYDRRYLITYSYYDAASKTQTVFDEVIDVPKTYDGNSWYDLKVPPGGGGVVPNSERVARAFRQIVPDGSGLYPWSEDPYEFGFLSKNDGDFANVGVLIFNPRGRDYTEPTPNGPQPLTAHIDYDVLDWHIIREDRPMPASDPFEVRLTLKGVKKVGEVEGDQTKYPGLFRDSKAGRLDILIYNLTTGQPVPPTDGSGAPNFFLDHKEGVLTFSSAFGAVNANGTFRFFYKAKGDWSLSAQKACQGYRRHQGASSFDANPGLAEYYLGGGVSGGIPTKMYFPLTEAGKTVSIRELWYLDAGGNLQRVSNESYRINANRTAFETLTSPGGASRVLTWIDLAEKHTDATSWPLARPVQPAVGVQGISFRARVLWKDGSSVQETPTGVVERIRWKKIDLDTFLTRSPN